MPKSQQRSPFDPSTFLDRTTSGVQLDTRRTAYPEGWKKVTISRIGDAQGKMRESKDGRPIVDIAYKLLDPIPAEVIDVMGQRDEYFVTDNFWLDIDDAGGLAFGPNKNTNLGALLDVLGLNDGSAWSFRQLVGQGPFWIQTGVRAGDDGAQYTSVRAYAATNPMADAA